jgi:hypothetical protein
MSIPVIAKPFLQVPWHICQVYVALVAGSVTYPEFYLLLCPFSWNCVFSDFAVMHDPLVHRAVVCPVRPGRHYSNFRKLMAGVESDQFSLFSIKNWIVVRTGNNAGFLIESGIEHLEKFHIVKNK